MKRNFLKTDYFPDDLTQLYSWTRNDFNQLAGAERAYFQRIEHCLNKAIFYSAMAVMFTIEAYESCDCDGEEKDHQYILNQLDHSETISSHLMPYFMITGFASTFLAIGSLVMGIKAKRA